ncbi:MAG: sulfur carrier protein ThiS [Planctomycetia bacterium]|nr:sulfur carrier protein ThiS [Planctomycetia bacterium]
MHLIVNGTPTEIPDSVKSITDLLQELGLAEKLVAVEVNKVLIPQTRHSDYILSDCDQVEAVTFVGGG